MTTNNTTAANKQWGAADGVTNVNVAKKDTAVATPLVITRSANIFVGCLLVVVVVVVVVVPVVVVVGGDLQFKLNHHLS